MKIYADKPLYTAISFVVKCSFKICTPTANFIVNGPIGKTNKLTVTQFKPFTK